MAFIGNQPISQAFLTDQFSGNGTTTAFTMSVAPATTSSILVSVTGVLQSPDTYSVVGTTLTFSAAPPTGTGNISVRYLGIPASGVTTTAYRTLTEFTATAGQTTFTPPSYTVGFINVYRNGVLLGTADYTATNGTTVVLAKAASVGDLVTTESFYVSSVLNALPTSGGTISGNLTLSSGLTVTGTETVTGYEYITDGTGSSSGEGSRLEVIGAKTFIASIPENQLGVADTTAMAAGVGGAVNFIGKYTSGGASTSLASIEGAKTNGTSGDYGGDLVIKTRVNGGSQTEKVRITTGGNLVLQGGTTTASGVGITFPATQSASTDANCLDDYEEGTFTPTLLINGSPGTGLTYSSQIGKYTKIGNQVTVTCYVALSNKGSTSGSFLMLGGMPFTTAASPALLQSGVCGYVINWTTAAPQSGYNDPGTAYFVLYASSVGWLGSANLSNTSTLSFTATYLVP